MEGACGKTGHFWSRRKVLGAAALPWLTPIADSLAVAAEQDASRCPKSVILLWMQGGMSQLESFDPHPGAAIAYGGRAIKTSLPGVQFSASLEQTAEWMHECSVVRSLVSQEGDHSRATYQVKTGHRLFPGIEHPSMGAIVCHQLPDPQIDIPTHISIISGDHAGRGGYLGAKYDAFRMGDPQWPVPDLSARVSPRREQSRYEALSILEESFAQGRLADLDAQRTQHISNTQRARQMMTSEQLAAFDVSAVPLSVKAPFGDHAFGRSCLAAVQLIESGVRCVEVTLGGWDTHINNQENQRKRTDILDPALASLIGELRARDRYDDTIVICATEFGRTPLHNNADGRDHWPHGFSALLGGGGIAKGRVIGQTDPAGEKKQPIQPVTVEDLHATVYSALSIDPEHHLDTPIGRPVPISEGRVVKQLLV